MCLRLFIYFFRSSCLLPQLENVCEALNQIKADTKKRGEESKGWKKTRGATSQRVQERVAARRHRLLQPRQPVLPSFPAAPGMRETRLVP